MWHTSMVTLDGAYRRFRFLAHRFACRKPNKKWGCGRGHTERYCFSCSLAFPNAIAAARNSPRAWAAIPSHMYGSEGRASPHTVSSMVEDMMLDASGSSLRLSTISEFIITRRVKIREFAAQCSCREAVLEQLAARCCSQQRQVCLLHVREASHAI